MPKRKILQTVYLHRNGERVKPAIGDIVDLTEDEYNYLTKNAPDSIGKPVTSVNADDVAVSTSLGLSDEERQKLKDELRAEILAESNEPEKTETAAQKKAREAKEAKDAAAAEANKASDDI